MQEGIILRKICQTDHVALLAINNLQGRFIRVWGKEIEPDDTCFTYRRKERLNNCQKLSAGGILYKKCSKDFCKIHRTVPESLF